MCIKKKIVFLISIKNFKNNNVKKIYFEFCVEIIRNSQIKIYKHLYIKNFY